jgi:hypothetical protein
MVQRQCNKCKAIFNQKGHYNYHINRKFDCSQNKDKQTEVKDDENDNLVQIQNIPKHSIEKSKDSKMDFQIPNINHDNKINEYEYNPDYNMEIEENNILIICGFCANSYSSKSNLNKHLKICKVKKTNDIEKENIFKLLLEKDKENKENKEIIEKLEKQNKLFEKQNKMLMDKLDKLDKLIEIKDNTKLSKTIKNKTITNNISNLNSNSNNVQTNNTQNTQNTQNNNFVIVNFGKEDLSIIDERQFIDRIVKNNISGVKIPDEVLKIIHFNPQYPQLSNIYISDINREKCMVYEDGEWKLSNVDNIPQIMDKVCIFSTEQINMLKTKYPNNKPLHDRLGTIEKYNNMIDADYVDDLRDDGRQVEIIRCEDFQKHAYNTLKKTLYNEGKKLKKTIKLK